MKLPRCVECKQFLTQDERKSASDIPDKYEAYWDPVKRKYTCSECWAVEMRKVGYEEAKEQVDYDWPLPSQRKIEF
jgi:hypothetical protein